MKNTLSIFFIFFLMLFTDPAFAQNGTCNGNTLVVSTASYAIGDFASVKRNLELCVQNQSFGSVTELNQARELLALTAIGEDRSDDAKLYIAQIVGSKSNFVSSNSNIVFDDILSEVKRENVGVTVSSVSKKAEDINTAPATVKLVTQEEIMDRGYKDLIDLLSDLPGFDISKVFSGAGSNVYQMGFRQENTERTLFMVDGVEENDLFSNWAYISRQYPLANIKAVEIVYGPSSTLYGPRAFVGTINVITYSPREIPEDHLLKGTPKSGKPKSFYAYGNTQAGNLNTISSDLVMGLRGRAASFQVTGRIYRSDEHDMSSAEFFDYAPDDIKSLRYTNMNMLGRAGSYTFEQYLQQFKLPQVSPYYTLTKNSQGLITNMNLTAAGINRARELDSIAYTSNVNGAPIGYSNHTDDYFFSAKLQVDNFLFGVRHWKRTEGFGLYQDIDAAGSRNGSVWSPENTTVYAQYDHQLTDKISISNLSNFALHRLGKESNRVNFVAFGDPRANLHFAHLLNPNQIHASKTLATKKNSFGAENIDYSRFFNFKHGWSNQYYHYEAQQFRNETRLFYEGERLKFSSGIDFRSTLTQGDYLIYMDYDTSYPDTKAFRAKQDSISFARELGIVRNQEQGSNLFSMIDLGAFIQANYTLGEKIFLTGGYRMDYNRIRRSGGFGFANSPRLSAIYNSENTTIKLNYSKGHHNVDQLTRYSAGAGRTPNPNLRPESIDFLNLEYMGHLGNRGLGWEVNAFGYLIENGVASSRTNNGLKNINIEKYRTTGLMSGFYYKPKSRDWNIQVNHTYFNPKQTAAAEDSGIKVPVRLGDIASHRVNLSVTKQTHLGILSNVLNLRANYVSARPIGINTTSPKNIGIDGKGSPIPEYLILHGNIGFKVQSLPMLRLDLSVENILNKNLLDGGNPEYYHPGPREASGTFNMPGAVAGAPYGDLSQPFIPQRPRFFLLRLSYTL
jgi:outer membrane receptor for ferrienterochelin and colicin